jgi:hypothetical protein
LLAIHHLLVATLLASAHLRDLLLSVLDGLLCLLALGTGAADLLLNVHLCLAGVAALLHFVPRLGYFFVTRLTELTGVVGVGEAGAEVNWLLACY